MIIRILLTIYILTYVYIIFENRVPAEDVKDAFIIFTTMLIGGCLVTLIWGTTIFKIV